MSGLEVLGAAASAIQLAQAGVAITRFFIHVRDAPENVQSRAARVQSLIKLAKLVASNPHLQTRDITDIIKRCVQEARRLTDLLDRLQVGKDDSRLKKWAKAFNGVALDKRIIASLDELETQKADLILCITNLNSSSLCNIDLQLKNFQGDIHELVQDMRESLPLLQQSVEALTIQFRDERSLVDQPPEEKRVSCLASLQATDQISFISPILGDSKQACEWFWSTPKFASWCESPDSDILWVSAKAGCGKTTLAAHLSQKPLPNKVSQADKIEVVNSSSEATPLLLVFFFGSSTRDADKTGSTALRNLISQFVIMSPRLFPILLQRYDFLSTGGKVDWTWQNLWLVFRQLLEGCLPHQPIYVILDAVDECELNSRQVILDSLRNLIEDLKIPADLKPLLKVFITSRPDPNIADSLFEYKTLEIKPSDTRGDMSRAIRNRMGIIARKRHLDESVKDTITKFMEENSHGMFIWAVLVMKELEKRDELLSDETIQTKLTKIPLTLTPTYTSIMNNVPPSRKQDMWRILRWLLYGHGLTLQELKEALCTELNRQWHDFPSDVEFLCGSLVRVNEGRGEITFAHHTVVDFLTDLINHANHVDLEGIAMDPVAANTHMATTCMEYFFSNSGLAEIEGIVYRRSDLESYSNSMEEVLARYQFLNYAIENWTLHMHATGQPSSDLIAMALKLLSSMDCRDALIRLGYYVGEVRRVGSPVNCSAIHIASYFNLPWLVEEYISKSPGRAVVRLINTTNDTPIVWAAETGSASCVKILLQAGADPNAFEYDGWSALHWAARNGHLDVVRLLVNAGARLDQRDDSGSTPQDWATVMDHQDIVELLLRRAEILSPRSKVPRREVIKGVITSIQSGWSGACHSLFVSSSRDEGADLKSRVGKSSGSD